MSERHPAATSEIKFNFHPKACTRRGRQDSLVFSTRVSFGAVALLQDHNSPGSRELQRSRAMTSAVTTIKAGSDGVSLGLRIFYCVFSKHVQPCVPVSSCCVPSCRIWSYRCVVSGFRVSRWVTAVARCVLLSSHRIVKHRVKHNSSSGRCVEDSGRCVMVSDEVP